MFFSSFKHRNYRILFIGTSLSNIGTWIHRIAQDWLVLELTDSAQALGIVVSAQFLPGFFFSLLGGSIADRLDRRKTLMACNVAGCFIASVLGFLVLSHKANVWSVAVAAFLLGTTNAIDGPIRQSYYVFLVGEKDLPNAMSLNSGNVNVGRLVGPVLSGILIEVFGTGPSFLINAASYIATTIMVFLIRPSEYQIDLGKKIYTLSTHVQDGFLHVFNRPKLLVSIFVVSFLAMWGQDMQITSAMMARETFAVGAASFGALGSIFAAGAIFGALSFSRRNAPPTIRLLGYRALLMSGAWFLASLAPTYALFALALFTCGWFSTGVNISGNVSIRTYAAPEFNGRAWGVYIFIWSSLIALGAPILGWINQNYSPRTAVSFGALMALTTAVCVLFSFRSEGSKKNDF